MHILEGTHTNLTTCTKMTEEVDRRHGVNGNSSSKGDNDESPVQNSAHSATGGRLKFFKDGKFILELVRGCAREGERAGWVSVPRKTFWPPAAPPPTAAPPRAERAASLSVSDDNSSIQSSPWQRDHCWKQAAPRRNISKELTMFYCRPSTLLSATIDAGSRLKRRRPFDASSPLAERRTEEEDRLRFYHKLKKGPQYLKLRAYRKRVLRELERVSLEEGKRRARPAQTAGPSRPRASYTIHSLLSLDTPPPPPPPPLYPYVPPYLPPLYRTPAPLYYYAVPPPWPPLAHPLLTDHHIHAHKDEPVSDLPLNLSKH